MNAQAPIHADTDVRRYNIVLKRDFHPGSDLHWQTILYGAGHWCRADGHAHWFSSREAAEAAGLRWVETGRV